MGRVLLTREVVHPEMLWMREVSGGIWHGLGIVRIENPRQDQRIPVIGSGAIREMEHPFPYILKAIH
jgi:hypothetical protein